MYIQTCLHPRKIYLIDPKTKVRSVKYVPCGKCSACLSQKSSKMVSAINREAKCWPYVYFFTLTFTNNSVRKLKLCPDCSLADYYHDFYISKDDDYLDSSSRSYLRNRKVMYYATSEDAQNFIKRLRYYFVQLHNDIKYKKELYELRKTFQRFDEKLRYCICLEYGPTTLRPHFHGILFFSSPLAAQKISRLVRKAWPFGNIDVQRVERSCSSYVASYVNGISCLPKIYTKRELRPFLLYSKCPSLGSLQYCTEEVKEIFHKCSPRISVPCGTRYVDVSLCSWLKNQLFPKIQGFSYLSHFDRVALYRIAEWYGFDEFALFEKRVVDTYGFKSDYKSEYVKLLSQLCFSFSRPKGTRDALYRLWLTSRKVLLNCIFFNVTLDDYVFHIEKFYKNVDYENLKLFYEFQSEYCADGKRPPSQLISMDLCFYNDICHRLDFDGADSLTLSDCCKLLSYGIDPEKFAFDKDYRDSLHYEHTGSFASLVSKGVAFSLKSKRVKYKNEYIDTHPDLRKFVFDNLNLNYV